MEVMDRKWSEINPEFGSQDILHDEKDRGLAYQSMEFEFENIERTIKLRGKSRISQSTGLALWTCSQILSGYLAENKHYVQEKRVLELGAGLG